VESLQSSIARGQTAEWVVNAWAINGDISNAVIRLTSTGHLTPEYSFGCGSYDSTASCTLGSVYSGSTERQVIASVAVPSTATTVTSVQLTVTASASDLSADPAAAQSVPVTSAASSPASPTAPATSTSTEPGSTTVSQLPVGSLPTVGDPGSTSSLSPGGNAASLFPTVNSSQDPSPSPGQGDAARPVADSESLPIGTPVVDGQLLGLGALAVAFLLAATRLSVRRRPAIATGRHAVGGAGGAGVVGGAAAGGAAAGATATRDTTLATDEPVKAEVAAADNFLPDDFTPNDDDTADLSLDSPAAGGGFTTADDDVIADDDE
jgi:hypothetical protein